MIALADVRMTVEEYLELLAAARETKNAVNNVVKSTKKAAKSAKKTGRKVNTAYSKAFKKVQNKYKTKAGKWKKGGFGKAVREAHKMARRSR